MKKWPTFMVESDGDYRNEMYLEEHIGGRLYEYQKKMPRLPIPSIADTIERFLPTALPLARTEEEKEGIKQACLLFPAQAEELHERLMQRRNDEMADSSWLQVWWNQVSDIFSFSLLVTIFIVNQNLSSRIFCRHVIYKSVIPWSLMFLIFSVLSMIRRSVQ